MENYMGKLKNDALKKRFEDREIPAVLEKMPENLRLMSGKRFAYPDAHRR